MALDHGGATVGSVWRFNQNKVGVFLGYRAMLRAFGHHKHFAGTKSDVLVAHFTHQAALYQEEIIGGFMFVPRVGAFSFGNHHVTAVALRDGDRRPGCRDGWKYRSQAY